VKAAEQEYNKAYQAKKKTEASQQASSADDPKPEHGLEAPWTELLLAKVKEMEPAAFERLSQRILRESGFTTGTFTPDARREATRDGAPAINFIDGDALIDLLKRLQLGVSVDQVVTEKVTLQLSFFDEIWSAFTPRRSVNPTFLQTMLQERYRTLRPFWTALALQGAPRTSLCRPLCGRDRSRYGC
jgi:hypothetical protein